jgi:hypothetical protein
MKELFLVCPFSNAEAYVRENINPEGYFMTSAASVFRFNSIEYIESIVEFIQRCEIKQIYCVASAECRFIKEVINGSATDDFFAVHELKKLHSQHIELFHGLSNREKIQLLTNLQIQQQAEDLSLLLAAYSIEIPVKPLLLKQRLVKTNPQFLQQSSR